MPLTKVDSQPALIVIDLQKGIAAMQAAHPVGKIVERSAGLARAFRARGWPVALVTMTAPARGRTDSGRRNYEMAADWAELLAEMEAQTGDILVSKHAPGAFLGTSLDEELRSRGVTQVFVVGIATNAGVEATARSAYDLGYNVVLVVDAMTAREMEAHRYCVEKVFPRIAETTITEDVLTMLG